MKAKDSQILIEDESEAPALREKVKMLEIKLENQELLLERLSNYNKELEDLLFSRTKELQGFLEDYISEGEEKKSPKEAVSEAKLANARYDMLSNARKLLQLNDKLAESEQHLKQANSAKDKFITIIAHDLLNPFQSLLLSTELLAKGVHKYSPEFIQQECKDINATVVHLADLLSNLLQWAKSQSGRIEYYPDYIDLEDIINEVLELFSVNARKKDIRLIKDLKRQFYPYSDKKMVNTVLRNLISNAIKFTPNGGEVKVSARSSKGFTEISVTDSGVGIDVENLQKLFRIDIHHTTLGTLSEKGTGVGLILCKEFAERNGGQIWAVSSPGKGTSFKFTLPDKPFEKLRHLH